MVLTWREGREGEREREAVRAKKKKRKTREKRRTKLFLFLSFLYLLQHPRLERLVDALDRKVVDRLLASALVDDRAAPPADGLVDAVREVFF
jgi:hypothetical protein